MSGDRREGGCLCGQVRYSVAWPPLQVMTCQCTHCQKQSGSAISIIAMVRVDDLAISGTLASYRDTGDSGNALERRFCGTCGSPLVSVIPAMEAQGMTFIKAGTLDDTSGLVPSVHLWTESAQDWMALPEAGARMPRQ
ncbi:MAG: GFA family protein [Novosphingobium sp.]|jgi:hypothetical protein|nr:GFA family protein [Brevundimonas sp.]MCZ8323253.1 GFA family protein [Novosphingobium sp.]